MARHLPHTRIDKDIVGKRVLAYPSIRRETIPLRIRGTAFRREVIHNTTLVCLKNCTLTANHRSHYRLLSDDMDAPIGVGVDGTVIWDIVEHKAGVAALKESLRSSSGRSSEGWRTARYEPSVGPAFYLEDGDQKTFIVGCDEAILDYTGKGCELWVKGWH